MTPAPVTAADEAAARRLSPEREMEIREMMARPFAVPRKRDVADLLAELEAQRISPARADFMDLARTITMRWKDAHALPGLKDLQCISLWIAIADELATTRQQATQAERERLETSCACTTTADRSCPMPTDPTPLDRLAALVGAMTKPLGFYQGEDRILALDTCAPQPKDRHVVAWFGNVSLPDTQSDANARSLAALANTADALVAVVRAGDAWRHALRSGGADSVIAAHNAYDAARAALDTAIRQARGGRGEG